MSKFIYSCACHSSSHWHEQLSLLLLPLLLSLLLLLLLCARFLSICCCIHKCCRDPHTYMHSPRKHTHTHTYVHGEAFLQCFTALSESRYLPGPTCRMSYGHGRSMINIQLHGTSTPHSPFPHSSLFHFSPSFSPTWSFREATLFMQPGRKLC